MSPLLSPLLHLCRAVAARWGVYLLMVAGLTLSYAAAIVVTLYVHDELTYDRFMPDADRVYLLSADYGPQGRPLVSSDRTPSGMAGWMASDGPEVERIAMLDDGRVVAVRQGPLLATAFHPEVTGEHRFHRLFLESVRGE